MSQAEHWHGPGSPEGVEPITVTILFSHPFCLTRNQRAN